MISVFYMFDIDNDLFRARQLSLSGDEVTQTEATDLDYEVLTRQSEEWIRNWIDGQLALASCLVILIGQQTAEQRWVKYAIGMARQLEMPMIGVAIDKLADAEGHQGIAGPNPFTSAGMSSRALSQLEIYDPPFATPVFARSHIKYSLRDWVELAVRDDRYRQTLRSRRLDRKAGREREEDAS